MPPVRRSGAAFNRLELSAAAALAFACGVADVAAQELGASEPVRRGEIAFSYQYQEAQDLVGSTLGTLPSAPITTQVLDVDVQYQINRHWNVFGGLPLIMKKWEGPPSHDPLMIIPPHPESDFVDDHEYHTYFQDWRLGVRYLITTDPIVVEPYLMLGVPSNDYPFFGAAAPGRNLKNAEVGATIGYRPPFLKWAFLLQAGYEFSEKAIDIDINASRVEGQVTYFANRRLAATLFVTSKNGKGVPVQAYDRTTEEWYHHDQTTRHNFINAGVGVDWLLNERHVLNFTMIRMVHAEDVFDLNEAFSITLRRSF